VGGTEDDRGIEFCFLKTGSVVNCDLANSKNRTVVKTGNANNKK
jgi:hypothetical protein